MENQSQTFVSLEKNAMKSTDQARGVAGHYQLFEFHGIGAYKKLVALPISVQISQSPELIALELRNESDGTTTHLRYPMNGASYWSEAHQAFIFTRIDGKNYVADFISPPQSVDRSARATYRITWQIDEQGRILEICEDFDADGKRLESSRGHIRTLVPMVES